MKKIIVIFLFVLLLAPDFAFALSKVQPLILKNAAANSETVLKSKILFVKDYCKIFVEVADNVQKSAALIFSSDILKTVLLCADGAQKSSLCAAANFNGFYKKAVFSSAKPVFLFSADNFSGGAFMFFIFIISALLLYIGLLRVFNASSLNKNTVKTGLAF